MRNSLIIGILALTIGIGVGYFLGKPDVESNLSPKDLKLFRILQEVNKQKPPKLRISKRLIVDSAKIYSENYYEALNRANSTTCNNPLHNEFLRCLYRSHGGWSMNLDALKNIWNKNGDIKYLYFYPAINVNDKAMTIITVGAKLHSTVSDSLILVHGKVPKILSGPDEIWDNASPCPSNCPGNGIQ